MTAIVTGRVQRAGFRDFIQQQAFRYRVSGTVRNTPDGTVEIVAEGDPSQLRSFLRAVKSPPAPVEVDRLETTSGGATGEFRDFFVRWDPNEAIIEKLETGFRYLRDMNHNFGDKMDTMANEQRAFGQRVDKHFAVLAVRYDRISARLERILKEMQAERRDARRHHERMIALILNHFGRDSTRKPRRIGARSR